MQCQHIQQLFLPDTGISNAVSDVQNDAYGKDRVISWENQRAWQNESPETLSAPDSHDLPTHWDKSFLFCNLSLILSLFVANSNAGMQSGKQKRANKIIHHLLYFIAQSNLFSNHSALLQPYVPYSYWFQTPSQSVSRSHCSQ